MDFTIAGIESTILNISFVNFDAPTEPSPFDTLVILLASEIGPGARKYMVSFSVEKIKIKTNV